MKQVMKRAWSTSPALMVCSAAMMVALGVFLILGQFDSRVVTGQPVWIKPAKFALSTALYSVTLAWMLSFVEGRRRIVWWVCGITTAVMVIEVGLIALQAGRGVSSHFNVGSSPDVAIFGVMGVAILAAWICGWVGWWLLLRQRFAVVGLGVAIRWGLAISLLGASVGGLMVQPSSAQVAQLGEGTGNRSGGHAVGAAEDGPGLPLVGWSTEGGDLRVSHFLGLHAMQLLPLLALLLASRSRTRAQTPGLMRIASLTFLLVVGVVLQQALRAEPLLAPGRGTVAALLTVLSLGGVAAMVNVRQASRRTSAGVPASLQA